jgi:formylglycine-generating enzyme required for sulfatase activity
MLKSCKACARHWGEFQMGSTDGRSDEQPVHTVRISQPFYLGVHTVTQSQWEAVMGNNPSRFTSNSNRPVEQVSWEDAQAFIGLLNAREEHARYRLPTEAEWEYAARAESTTAYCFGDDHRQLRKYAWYSENAGGQTHPVGILQPNAWGLYDIHGNVWEWVQDWYSAYAAEQSPLAPRRRRLGVCWQLARPPSRCALARLGSGARGRGASRHPRGRPQH